jgi:branched-chain amino acid transport system permease protein
MIKLPLIKQWWLILAFAIFIVIPNVAGAFWTYVFTEILIMGMWATSFNLLYGYMGEVSFGQAAYYGMGSYVTALMLTKTSIPFPIPVIASAVIAGIFGLIFGFFIVRLTGIYFAMLAMDFGAFIFYNIFQRYDFTGGDNGIQGIPRFWLFESGYAYYYFTLAVVTASVVALWFITNSPFGYTLRAIRDNKDRTRFLGINIKRYMLLNFVISCVFTGLAGSLWASFSRSISPDLTSWKLSGIPVFMAIMGGRNNFFGPLLGALVYTFLSAFVIGFTEYWPIIIGTIIVLIIIFRPGGILGTLPIGIKPVERNSTKIQEEIP